MEKTFDLDKIKFSIDPKTFDKAVDLYKKGKVTKVHDNPFGYEATVLGTHPYSVSVNNKYLDQADCTCYLGENDVLCKHVIALALHVVMAGKPMTQEDKKQYTEPVCNIETGELDKDELQKMQQEITTAMRYIKAYRGPSSTWFRYQNSLSEGCARLASIISQLPVSEQTAKILVDILLRLDRKLLNAVDDSDGTVGTFIEQTVQILLEYYFIDKNCSKAFKKLKNKETMFGWEEALVNIK